MAKPNYNRGDGQWLKDRSFTTIHLLNVRSSAWFSYVPKLDVINPKPSNIPSCHIDHHGFMRHFRLLLASPTISIGQVPRGNQRTPAPRPAPGLGEFPGFWKENDDVKN